MPAQPYRDLIEGEVEKVLTAAGSDEKQKQDGLDVLPRLLDWRNGVAVVKATGEVLSREWIEANKSHLLPRPFQTSLADQAFIGVGNKTAATKLIQQVGIDQATRIAATYKKRTPWDTRPGVAPEDSGGDKAKSDREKNPWNDASPQGEARRLSAIKSLPTKVVNDLAKAAGKTLDGRPLRVRA